MQSLNIRRKNIISDIENLEEICKKTGYCQNCVAYQNVKGLKIRDFIGCPFTNYITRSAEEYQFRKGYDSELDSSIIRLTFNNPVAAITNEYKGNVPNRNNILVELSNLKTILSKKNRNRRQRNRRTIISGRTRDSYNFKKSCSPILTVFPQSY